MDKIMPTLLRQAQVYGMRDHERLNSIMGKSQFSLQNNIETLYAHQPRQLAFRAQSLDDFQLWKTTTRAKFLDLLGIAGRRPPVDPKAEFLSVTDRGAYVEQKFALDVGEGVVAPMYILVPKT